MTSFDLPPHRRALLRRNLLEHVSQPRPRPRRVVATAVAFGALALAGAAVAVDVGIDFLAEQDRVDGRHWAPPEDNPAGARIEIARGADWSFMAWESARGICVAWAAGTADNWARACGLATDRLITALFSSSADANGMSAIVGAVALDVHRLGVELADGRTLSAPAEPAPALDADARFFIIRVRADVTFADPTLGNPPIRAYVLYGEDGRELERRVVR